MDEDGLESSQLNPLKRSFVEALRGFSNSQQPLNITPDPKRRNVDLVSVSVDIIKIEVSKVTQ